MNRIPGLLMLLLLLVPMGSLWAKSDQEAKLSEVVGVLDAINKIPEKKIPPALLANAEGIAIIPNVVKIGFILGGRYGKGVVLVRQADGAWGNPAFVSIKGGGVGWQIGAQSTDIILVFKSKKGIDGITNGKFTLGLDAAVAAGPVGRNASASTDAQLKAEIYSYSRSRGLFAGLSLEGAALKIQNADNANYYKEFDITPSQIFSGANKNNPASAAALKNLLGEYARQ